jgi:hypothetical protein
MVRLWGAMVVLCTVPALAADGAKVSPPAADPVDPSAPALVEGSDAPVQLARRRRKKKKKAPAAEAGTPAPAAEAPAPSSAESSAPVAPIRQNGPSRIEFDDRLIQGQTNKANAIYLFERRASELRTLVKKRRHYHREIDETLQ